MSFIHPVSVFLTPETISVPVNYSIKIKIKNRMFSGKPLFSSLTISQTLLIAIFQKLLHKI